MGDRPSMLSSFNGSYIRKGERHAFGRQIAERCSAIALNFRTWRIREWNKDLADSHLKQ